MGGLEEGEQGCGCTSLGSIRRKSGVMVKWVESGDTRSLTLRGMLPAFLKGSSRLTNWPAMQERDKACDGRMVHVNVYVYADMYRVNVQHYVSVCACAVHAYVTVQAFAPFCPLWQCRRALPVVILVRGALPHPLGLARVHYTTHPLE